MINHEIRLIGEGRAARKELLCSRKADRKQRTGSTYEVKGQVRGCERWKMLGSEGRLLEQHSFGLLWQYFSLGVTFCISATRNHLIKPVASNSRIIN